MTYPNAPLGYYAQPTNPRPTSVTVMAVLGIIFGSLGVLGGLCGVIGQFITIGAPNPVMEELKSNTPVFTMTVIMNVLQWIVSILLLAGSIGALSLKPSARGVLLAYAIASLALQAAGLIMYFAFTAPVMERAIQKLGAPAALIKTTMQFSMALGVLFGAALPIIILIIMNRPHVKAAFGRGYAQPPFDPGYPVG